MTSVSIDQKGQYVGPSAQDAWPAELSTRRKFLIFGVLAFGQFMALIDIQIVAASLNDIQAGLSAGPDEISWVQTAYLMAELVMIPFSAFLAGSLSTRWLFSLSAGLFTVSSIACGFAWNIESMIVFRAVQGFVGGAMVPTAFSVGFTLFEGKQRAMIPAILGIVSVLAPTLGPTVGGIITQAIDWRWIFFINVLPGIVITTLAVSLIRVDKPNLSLLAKIDWVHLMAMAVALACLQYVLEEGPRKDWFGDPHIQIVAWCSLVGFVLFFERSFASHNPIVRLTPFGRPTFTFSCVFNLVVGFGLYASTYLVPVYLGRVRGYDSLQIGTTVFIVGLGQIVGTIISARLSQTVDRRILLAIGLTGFSFSLWLASHLNAQWGFWELALPQVVRGLSIMFCIVPTVGMALGGFHGAELRNASGLFNLMRNLGGAIGIATVNTWLGDAARIQAARFGEAMAGGGRVAEETLTALATRMSSLTPDPNHALSMAQAVFGRLVGREALVVGFGEVFRTMSWMFVIALVMVPFCDGRPEGVTDAAPSPDTH